MGITVGQQPYVLQPFHGIQRVLRQLRASRRHPGGPASDAAQSGDPLGEVVDRLLERAANSSNSLCSWIKSRPFTFQWADLFWLVLVCAMAVALWVERGRPKK